MNILFYLAAGNGDLINFTGVLNVLKATHPHHKFDMLIPRKHFYIMENHPAINKLIALDDFPSIPQHCTLKNHDEMVCRYFRKSYDHILNCWGCKINDNNNGDYARVMLRLMSQYGFYLPVPRIDINPMFYYTYKDYEIVYAFAQKNILPNKRYVLVEEQSDGFKTPQSDHVNVIRETLKSKGYMVTGNLTDNDICVKSLNLKHIKLFFEQYCCGFLGLSSGMTCAIYAEPTYFHNKKVVISGLYPGWDVGANMKGRNSYFYFPNIYTTRDIDILFDKVED